MAFGVNEALGVAGAAVGTALNLFGGARAARNKRRMLADAERKNENWFNQEYYSSPLERAAWQASLSGMLEGHNQRMAAARGASAVSGASAGSVLAEKSAANQSMGQTMRDAAAGHEAYQQNVRNEYTQQQQNILNQRLSAEEARAQQLAQAGSEASKLGAGAFGKSTT